MTRKSINFKNARFRESLIEISVMCEDNSIHDFVQNLDDINVFFRSMSPIDNMLLQNAFKKTRFTREIKSADWKIGEQLFVFGDETSIAR